MSNWCYNETVFYSVGETEVLERFKSDLLDAMSENPKKFTPVENDWNNNWLGNIFLAAGYSEDDVVNGAIHCRGYVIDYIINDDNVVLYYESAWKPMYESFDEMLYQKYPDLRQVTLAEENGNGVYVNTDIGGLYFSSRYLIDCCIIKDGEEEYYHHSFETEKEIVRFVNDIYGTSFKSFKEIEDNVDEIDDIHNGDTEFFMVAVYAEE